MSKKEFSVDGEDRRVCSYKNKAFWPRFILLKPSKSKPFVKSSSAVTVQMKACPEAIHSICLLRSFPLRFIWASPDHQAVLTSSESQCNHTYAKLASIEGLCCLHISHSRTGSTTSTMKLEQDGQAVRAPLHDLPEQSSLQLFLTGAKIKIGHIPA